MVNGALSREAALADSVESPGIPSSVSKKYVPWALVVPEPSRTGAE